MDWLPSAMSSSSGEDLHLPEWSVDFKVGEDFNITNKYTGEVNRQEQSKCQFRTLYLSQRNGYNALKSEGCMPIKQSMP